MNWTKGAACQVIEHDDATRQPRPGGQVLPGVVEHVGKLYVRVRFMQMYARDFYRESGWAAWDGMFRWRLAPEQEGGQHD